MHRSFVLWPQYLCSSFYLTVTVHVQNWQTQKMSMSGDSPPFLRVFTHVTSPRIYWTPTHLSQNVEFVAARSPNTGREFVSLRLFGDFGVVNSTFWDRCVIGPRVPTKPRTRPWTCIIIRWGKKLGETGWPVAGQIVKNDFLDAVVLL